MEHNPPPNIPEDYKAWAKVSTEDREFSVPCKIYLPKTIIEKPQIYIFPERLLNPKTTTEKKVEKKSTEWKSHKSMRKIFAENKIGQREIFKKNVIL